ncbi:MAG TPA: hypothetical protein VIJ55_07465 [Acetobacteraceae bacterium]
MSLPAGATPPSAEAIREWFRRTCGREPTEAELNELRRTLARTEPERPAESC